MSHPNKNRKGDRVPGVAEPGPIGTGYGRGNPERKLGVNSLRNSRYILVVSDGPWGVENTVNS